jgi:hypothetical protein
VAGESQPRRRKLTGPASPGVYNLGTLYLDVTSIIGILDGNAT